MQYGPRMLELFVAGTLLMMAEKSTAVPLNLLSYGKFQ
jgi:hypothetical protein